jgi:hypothetical protein
MGVLRHNAEVGIVPVKKNSVKSVQWPSSDDAAARIQSLRVRDAEIGELVRGHDSAQRIAELEKQVRYLKALSMIERAKNPWWIVMQVRYVVRAVARRVLKR